MTHLASCFDLHLTPLDFLLSIQVSLRFFCSSFFPSPWLSQSAMKPEGRVMMQSPGYPQLGTVTTAAGGICAQPSGLCCEKTGRADQSPEADRRI